jgi:hypothetical protein
MVEGVVAETLGLATEDAPGIMRAYCDGQSLGPLSHTRFVANSPIRFTDSDTALAGQGNGGSRALSRTAGLAPYAIAP